MVVLGEASVWASRTSLASRLQAPQTQSQVEVSWEVSQSLHHSLESVLVVDPEARDLAAVQALVLDVEYAERLCEKIWDEIDDDKARRISLAHGMTMLMY